MKSTGEADRDYYTVSEAADGLAVSPSTVWRWTKSGKLRAYRVGHRTIRIKRQDLEAMIVPIELRCLKVVGDDRTEEIWAGYDPEAVIAAIERAAGTLSNDDADAWIEDLYRAREEGSRPWNRP